VRASGSAGAGGPVRSATSGPSTAPAPADSRRQILGY
jgi:hypothetical protein